MNVYIFRKKVSGYMTIEIHAENPVDAKKIAEEAPWDAWEDETEESEMDLIYAQQKA